MLSVVYAVCNLCRKQTHYADCLYAERRYYKCHYAECRGAQL